MPPDGLLRHELADVGIATPARAHDGAAGGDVLEVRNADQADVVGHRGSLVVAMLVEASGR